MMKKGLSLFTEAPFTLPGVFFRSYKQLGLTDSQFLVLLHIHQFHHENHFFPTPTDLCERMTLTENECTTVLKQLLKSQFIKIEEQVADKIEETIQIAPLFERMYELAAAEQEEKTATSTKELEGKLFQSFEEEFARPLTPMEAEMISMWLDDDKHDVTMIQAALREAVLSSKLNFRYIDRILHEWKRKNIRTTGDAKEHSANFRKKAPKVGQAKPRPSYNWLEGGR
ncbi:DnaD domain-containing protein [Paenalkalicoccus suaedae]|uniref:DnaD domain-containing protein n=1 Tax=Paenalkalicoccus suaedae TaxID=2592382 RepID=A0A859FE25_9BACI|nr:DnaD domain-containing protein [Paenalkalicoccus suaedae]QKS71130.1 DnaD domain-containing protein [Paenalkalicoccus suaedae]